MHFFNTSSASEQSAIFSAQGRRENLETSQKKKATGYPSSWGPENSVCDLELRGETAITKISKIQLVVYQQCCVLIGWATTRLYVIAHATSSEKRGLFGGKKGLKSSFN